MRQASQVAAFAATRDERDKHRAEGRRCLVIEVAEEGGVGGELRPRLHPADSLRRTRDLALRTLWRRFLRLLLS